MQEIKQLIAERNIVIKGGDAFTLSGFTQVPNAILRSAKLTPAAKMTYAMLLSCKRCVRPVVSAWRDFGHVALQLIPTAKTHDT